jgi:hypothetical protein
MVAPEDFLIIPEIFGFVMEQVKDLPCGKVVLCQAYDHMLETLAPGVTWSQLGVYKCITTSETQKNYISEIMKNVSVDLIEPYIDETFSKKEKPSKPIISIHTRDQRATAKIIKTFYSFLPRKKIKNIFYYNQIFTGAFFFKKNCFEKFKNFNINYKYAFEYEFIIFLLKNYIGLYVDNFYAAFRILPNSLSSNKNLLENEKKNIFSSYDLIYSNSMYLRIYSYFLLGILLKVIINSIFDKNKNKNIIDYYTK